MASYSNAALSICLGQPDVMGVQGCRGISRVRHNGTTSSCLVMQSEPTFLSAHLEPGWAETETHC